MEIDNKKLCRGVAIMTWNKYELIEYIKELGVFTKD